LVGMIQALDTLKKAGAPPIDLMVFDMCLMSQLEVMDAISPYASYAVASEEEEPGTGYPNTRVLYQLTKNPKIAPRDLALVMVQEWSASYKEAGEQTVTDAAIDLSKIKDVVSSVDELAAALMKSPPAAMPAIGRAREASNHFPGNDEGDFGSYDLGNFVEFLAKQPEAASFKPQLDRVAATVDAAVMKHEEGDGHKGASGLAIYFPFDKNVAKDYSSIPFSRTQWKQFLTTGGGQAAEAKADVHITSPDPGSPHSIGTGIPIEATVSGNPASIHASLGFVDKNKEIVLISEEEIMSPGAKVEADGSYVPAWKDGAKFTFTLQPQVSAITDGKNVAMAPLYAMSPGNKFSVGYASYNSKLGDMRTAPVFDMKAKRLETIFCLSEDGNDAPMEVHPVKGENLVFYQKVIAGENAEPKFRPTSALTISGKTKDSLKLIQTDLPKGEYVLALTAYAADGKPSGNDVIHITADGENVAQNVSYPDYGYPTVQENDIDYVDMKQIVPADEYDHFEGSWDDYDFMEETEADDYTPQDLSYLNDVEPSEEEMQFDENDWSDELQDEEENGTVEEVEDETDQAIEADEDQDQQQEQDEDTDQNQDEDQDVQQHNGPHAYMLLNR
jgi:hypothetical protein